VTDPFSSCWLKIQRAREHLKALDSEITEWNGTKPYTVEKHCNADGSRYSVVLRIKDTFGMERRLERWSLIAGDCTHNLRSALDHLVYVLAIRNSGSNPPPKERSLEFPIFECPKRFAEKAGRISPLSDKAKAFIEGLQPYKTGNPHRSFNLRSINDFDNSDKHRLLRVVMGLPSSGQLEFEAPFSNLRPDVKFNFSPVNDGTELACFTLLTPQPSVEYKVRLCIDICVHHVSAPNGSIVSQLGGFLTELREIVEDIVVGARHL
jgi:hypothetical protein